MSPRRVASDRGPADGHGQVDVHDQVDVHAHPEVHVLEPSGPKLKEYCGVLAVYRAAGGAAALCHRGLFALQHRGQEAAGIATWGPEGDIHHLRHVGLVVDALPVDQVQKLPGAIAIGHTRYSTLSSDRSENLQPFLATTPYGRLAIAHNGNIKNFAEIAAELEGQGALLSTTLDTEVLVHLLARSGAPSFETSLQAMARRAVGAYSLAFICGGRLFGLRDPLGIRPLVLGERPDGFVLASETCALDALGARTIRELNPGELVELGPEGVRSTQLLTPAASPAPCVFELVYFARPDSVAFGDSVHQTRVKMGEALAAQDLASGRERPDVVVPIPDSGFPAAIGYSRVSGVPFEKAIIRSHYVGRTFILPDQDSRVEALRLKLSVIAQVVRDKRVLLVDDSIVRGNTSKLIVDMVREAGAREVWLRIASPPIRWPCYLGIDTPDHDELVINVEGSVEGVRRAIGADDLAYLSVEGLAEATGRRPYCRACMTGEYPL